MILQLLALAQQLQMLLARGRDDNRCSAAAATLMSVYILGIVFGYVSMNCQPNGSALTLIVALLAISILLRPDVLNRLRVTREVQS